MMTITMAESVAQWKNSFSSAVGILGDYSPSKIIEEQLNPDFNRLRVHFGSYVMVYNQTTTNMAHMSVPAITLK